jgi:hypothetical protein
MARICSAAADYLSAAQGILASCKNKNNIDDDLLTYVTQDREFAQASLYKWMGREADKAGKTGESLGCIQLSLSLLKKLRGSKLSSISARVKAEYAIVEELQRNWAKYNDSVAFEQILDAAGVLGRVPSGREVLAMRAFQTPKLRFGDVPVDEGIPGTPGEYGEDSEEDTRSYAGKGSYY